MTKNTKTKPQPISTVPARAERPHKGLTATQEQLAELCSDILMNGGARAEVDLFLRALDQHYNRRALTGIYQQMGRDSDALENTIQQHGLSNPRNPERWYRALSKEWPEPGADKRHEKVYAAAPVRELVRARIDEGLREEFEKFMSDVDGVEQMWILNEVLEYVNSAGDEIPSAFSIALQSDQTYVRVPWNFAEKVREFVDLLEKRPA